MYCHYRYDTVAGMSGKVTATRKEVFQIRLNKAELQQIRAKARAQKLKVSAYIRQMAVGEVANAQ